jgi:membrane associated rhomboid family serine protease
MGIQDRDYYRESTGGFLDAWGRQGVTVWVIVITCVVFFAQCVGGPPQRSELVATGAFFTPAILSGEVWRLVTPLFLHADFWHLFVNMFVLYWVGSRLDEMHGGWEFLAFYLCAGVFANAIAFGLEASGIAPLTLGIGASGAVTAAFVVYAFNFPRQTVLLFFVLPMPMWVALISPASPAPPGSVLGRSCALCRWSGKTTRRRRWVPRSRANRGPRRPGSRRNRPTSNSRPEWTQCWRRSPNTGRRA